MPNKNKKEKVMYSEWHMLISSVWMDASIGPLKMKFDVSAQVPTNKTDGQNKAAAKENQSTNKEDVGHTVSN